MTLTFFKGKKGNWICPAADGKLIVANGDLSETEVQKLLANGEGRLVGDNVLIGFGGETIAVDVKKVTAHAQAESSKPTIEIVVD